MLIKPTTILRNEEGSSPGGGAPVAPPAPSDPGTPAPAAPSAISSDMLKSIAGEVVAAALPKLRDGVFAELRKSGALKKEAADPAPTNPPQNPGAPTATGLSMADVEAMLERERVITARATKHDLNDAQIRRMKAALTGVAADQFATEADSFLSDLGLVKAPTPQQATPAPLQPQPTNAQPISDKGSPVPGGVTDWEREFAEKPHMMSPAAISAMNAKHGAEKARRMRVERVAEMGAAIRVQVKP